MTSGNVGLRSKPPQEQTACLAHINTWLIIIATESISKKKWDEDYFFSIQFEGNTRIFFFKECHIGRIFSLLSSSVRLICSGRGGGSGRLPVACLVKGPDVSCCEDVDGSHGATS